MQLWQGGDPSGVPVVFFHGCPDTRHAAFSGDAPARAAGVRLIAFNRPGYGRSDAFAFTHASVADDAMALADALAVERFAVVGMSVGGQYALAAAARHPARVTAVAALATPAVVPELDPPVHRDDLPAQRQLALAHLAAVPVDEAVELARPEFEDFVARIAPADPDDVALARRWLATLPPGDATLVGRLTSPEGVAAAVREALAQHDGYLRDAALAFRDWPVRPEAVRCPTWLWYGADDPNVSLRSATWLREHVSGSRLVVHPGTTHLQTLLAHWATVLRPLASVR